VTLTAGPHAIAVILSNGMYNVRGDARYSKFSNTGTFGPRTLWLSVDVTQPDGRVVTGAVVSDSQWLCDASGGPLTFTHTYGGEDWDAALEESGWQQARAQLQHVNRKSVTIVNVRWDQPLFNASSAWQPAQTWPGPGCALVPSDTLGSPLVVREHLDTVRVFPPKGGGGDVYDFGRNFMGWPRLKVWGPRGSVVRMVCGEMRSAIGGVASA
jgi:alpha-L-rhamnosidase